ncbi:MAG: DASS family sodium-coupled anion symporter [Acidobacteriota bacterium]|nr:DASS family sodium-coupled anion symporter [Blastocatellia bacterium]MDW8411271.1 DASS family sodium-coupled anion symporter [Acidobacteriota bacterium]
MNIRFSPEVTVIHRKTFWKGLASRLPQPAFLGIFSIVFVLILNAPTPKGLSLQGQKALAIFALCLLLWVWGKLPLVITSILAIVLLPLLGVMTPSKTYALFGNEAVFFILGAFILAAALMSTGLSSRIALSIMERAGRTPIQLYVTVYLLSVTLAIFMSEHAVAAMLFPIVAEIAHALKLKPKQSSYATLLFLAMAWGSSIGGITTFLGGARAPLAVGILKETTGSSISFLSWALAALPITVTLATLGGLLLLKFFPIDIDNVVEAQRVLRARNNRLGSIKYGEALVAVITLATVIAWIVLGEGYGLASIALLAVVALFAANAVRWKEIEERVSWGIILMYGGAICLGAALAETGAAKWLAFISFDGARTDKFTLVALFSLASYLLTEFMSNAAVVATLLPVALPLADSCGVDPRLVVYAVAIPAGLGFALPMGTPANAIAYSSGYVERKQMLLPGVIFGLISWAVFNVISLFLWPILGITD